MEALLGGGVCFLGFVTLTHAAPVSNTLSVPLLIRGRHSRMNRQLIQQVFTQRMPFQPQPISGKHPHKHSHTHSYNTDNLAYPIHLYRMSLDIGGETGAPGGNPRDGRENMQTPHRNAN